MYACNLFVQVVQIERSNQFDNVNNKKRWGEFNITIAQIPSGISTEAISAKKKNPRWLKKDESTWVAYTFLS